MFQVLGSYVVDITPAMVTKCLAISEPTYVLGVSNAFTSYVSNPDLAWAQVNIRS